MEDNQQKRFGLVLEDEGLKGVGAVHADWSGTDGGCGLRLAGCGMADYSVLKRKG